MSESHEETSVQPIEPDAALLSAHDVALKALTEITGVQTIGALQAPEVHEPRLITMFFDSLLSGYPGWRWAATLAKVSDDDPVTVLEVGMVPGDHSLVAPEWVPWGERLASYREAQEQLAAEQAEHADHTAAELDDDDELDDEDELLDNDFSDFDNEIDGIDIDALDETALHEHDEAAVTDEDDDDSEAAMAALDEEE